MEDHDDLYVIREGFIYDAHTGERLGAHDQNRKPFDANAHLRKIRTRQGMQDYLDVKWRVAWLRADFPNALIVTEQVDASPDYARFKATITTPDGGVGTGHGSETQGDFPDFYEKAETKAIGRACAALGYGTDAAGDFDDPPVEPREQPTRQNTYSDQSAGDTYKRKETYPVKQPQEAVRAPSPAVERVREVSGAHTLTARPPGRSPRAVNAQRAREQEMMEVAVPGFKPKGGPVRTEDDEARAHLEANKPDAPPTPPAMPVNDQASNLHQHAQLRAMVEAGVPVMERVKALGKDTLEALTRDEAKNVIIECRSDVRKLALS